MNHPDRLYDLIPVIYRQRDAEQGYPLRGLLRVIAEQVNIVENDITRLCENWFVETCQDWVVPYIGDLIGYRIVHEGGEPGNLSTLRERQRNKILIPRREVANTIRYRRRKGTLALLEELAAAVAGWPARAVEFDRLVAVKQSVNHLRPRRGRTADLHDAATLELLGTPFDRLSRTLDLRGAATSSLQGTSALASVGVFVWRLRAYPMTRTPAYCLEEVGDHCFTFSILGNNIPLYNRPVAEAAPTDIAGELNLPIPIRRKAFDERILKDGVEQHQASAKYYGETKSVAISAGTWAKSDPANPIPPEKIIVADLSDWKYRPKTGYVAVDPELGRIAFRPGEAPEKDVTVAYSYGFGGDIGGGTYDRPLFGPCGEAATYRVGTQAEFASVHEAYEKWRNEKRPNGIIEIMDNGVYQEQINIELGENERLELRAANGTRPVIYLVDWRATRPDAFGLSGGAGSAFCIDGVLVAGRGIEVQGKLKILTIRHSTLVPGWGLEPDCKPRRAGEPSLELLDTSVDVRIEHSIIGRIEVIQKDSSLEPLRMHISDSIIDATKSDSLALNTPNSAVAPLVLTIHRSTVIGEVQTHAISLAENCIFTAPLHVARSQQGCMRFCYVPPGSRTPQRYQCQPDLIDKIAQKRAQQEKLSAEEIDALRSDERSRVQPRFVSTRYGKPAYCKLADTSAVEIRQGADDRSELGAFHDLYEPQREANLRARLDEYVPAGISAGIIFAS